jgi:cytochrome c2
MHKEVYYVWQGALLLVVVLIGMWFVQVLANIKVTESREMADANCGTVSTGAPVKLTGNSWKGKELFENNCATCHHVWKDMTGPALGGIEDRVRDKKRLYAWIRNSPAVLKSGDTYFTGLYSKWNQTPMNVFPNLRDEEIDNILSYIRQHIVAAPTP